MVGDTLWKGVLLVLDAVFHVRKDRCTRVHIEDYRNVVGNRDKKLLQLVNNGYELLHLVMGYDGVQDKDTCDSGFRIAGNIIERCAVMLASA